MIKIKKIENEILKKTILLCNQTYGWCYSHQSLFEWKQLSRST